MASIRIYFKYDVILGQKLLDVPVPENKGIENYHYMHIIDKEAQNLIDDVKSSISNDRDVKMALEMAQEAVLIVK